MTSFNPTPFSPEVQATIKRHGTAGPLPESEAHARVQAIRAHAIPAKPETDFRVTEDWSRDFARVWQEAA